MDASVPGGLVVVGGGLAGMVAATRAALAGLPATVLEKGTAERYLCNSRVAGGVFHVCARDIFSDPGELHQAILAATGGYADPALAMAVATDAARAGRWLQAQGVRFMRGSAEPFHNFVLAPPALLRAGLEFEGRAGDVALRTLEKVLSQHGGRVLRGHRAEALECSGGRVIGVQGQGPAGPFAIAAQAVLLADGGFQADPQLLAAHITPAPERVLQRNARTGTGDGLRMAERAGARLTRLDGFYGHLLAQDAMTNDRLWPMPWLDDVAMAGILVDGTGRRFADEGAGGVFLANRVARLPDPLGATIVFDAPIWDVAGRARFFPARPYLEDNGATILRAGSLAELAAAMGLPTDNLEDEVARHNAAVAAERLHELAPARSQRKARALPIRGEPYMAARVCAGITYTMGGIAIDEFGRVLHAQGGCIDGLYAAGATTGGLEGGDLVGYSGGLTKAAATGLRAAEHVLGLLA